MKQFKTYAACSCGNRFALDDADRRELLERLSDQVFGSCPTDALSDSALNDLLESEVWPEDITTEWSKIGVAPVGTRALHTAAAWVIQPDGPAVTSLADRMIRTMRAADGIGLAANQVAIAARVIVHSMDRVAPSVLVNPSILWRSLESWEYSEGCLSLKVEGTRASLRRPKEIMLVAALPDGGRIAARASELFARVLMHEVDHLDGIEYVQRLSGSDQRTVYDRIASAGVDLAWLPLIS